MNEIIHSIIFIQISLKEFITSDQFEVQYLLDWFNSSIEMIFNHLEILQSGFNISFIKWKEDRSFNSDYSFNRNCFFNLMKISLSLWIKSSIEFHQIFEWKICLFQNKLFKQDLSIFLASFGLEWMYSIQQRVCI